MTLFFFFFAFWTRSPAFSFLLGSAYYVASHVYRRQVINEILSNIWLIVSPAGLWTDPVVIFSVHEYIIVCAQLLSCVQLFVTPWTVAHQALWNFPGRKLEQVVISTPRGSSQPRDWPWVSCDSCIGRQILYHRTLGSLRINSAIGIIPHQIPGLWSRASMAGKQKELLWNCSPPQPR